VIVTHLSFRVTEQHAQDFEAWFAPLVARTLTHRGCLSYDHLIDPADPSRHVLLEVWASPSALSEHATTAEHAEIIGRGSDDFGMYDLVLHRWADARAHSVTSRPRTTRDTATTGHG
jgi:quinol monooxygenase YgiN